MPFFGELGVSEVTPGKVQDYRVHRATTPSTDEVRTPKPATDKPPAHKPPSRSTLHVLRDNLAERDGSHLDCRAALHDEIVTLRLALKTAIRHGWLTHLPDLSPPYRTQGKAVHRAWLSPAEYKQLYEATREYAKTPALNHYRWNAEQVHDYVLFLANTGLRPDEASRLQHRDVTPVLDRDTNQRILEIDVRGKRGVGYCKSMPGAVVPYERVCKRNRPSPSDLVFGKVQRELLNAVLGELDLKFDREGLRRTAYSLRHTYICMRLMEGADIYQIAKNCRTSVEMIETFYAAHIKNLLDTAAINVRRKPQARREAARSQAASGPDRRRSSL